MLCPRTQKQKKQKKPNTRKRKGQDTTKITSAPAESCIQFPWSVMPISMTTLTWMVRNIPNRTTIKEFTEEIDETGFVRQYNFFHLLMRMLCLCFGSYDFFAWCCAPFFQLCDHGDINTALGREFGQIVTRRRSSPWSLLLWSPRILSTHHWLGVRWWDHEAREGYWGAKKLRNGSKYQENEAMVPITWSREWSEGAHWNGQSILPGTGTNWGRRWEGLRWETVTCLHQYLNELPIRELEKTEQYRNSDRTRKRCTVPPPKTPTQKAWFDCCRSVFPQTVRKAGPDVNLYYVPMYQLSILFYNMGSFNKKSEFRKAVNIDKPISSNKRFNVTDDPHLSLLTEFWGNNYAHVLLTAEADSLPADAKELIHGHRLVGCHSSKSNDLTVHDRIDSSGFFRRLWESDVGDRNGHAAIFEVEFGKKINRATDSSRERSAEHLLNDLHSVAFVVEGSDLGASEDCFEPTASCINDIKRRQLVTRSGLSRLRCCVCHLHHKRAMDSPTAVRDFFGTVPQQVCHLKIDVFAGDGNAAGYKYYKK